MSVSPYTTLLIPDLSAMDSSPALVRLLANRIDVEEIKSRLSALRTSVHNEISPSDIEDKITWRKYPLKNIPQILNAEPKYLTREAVSILCKFSEDQRNEFTTPLFKCRYWGHDDSCCHFEIQNPMTRMVVAMGKKINDSEAQKIVHDFLSSINFSKDDQRNVYWGNERQQLYQGLKSSIDIICNLKTNEELISFRSENYIRQIPYGELLLKKILEVKRPEFEDLVCGYSALAETATDQIKQWYLDKFRFRDGRYNDESRVVTIRKRMSKAEYSKEGRKRFAEILDEFIAIRKEMVRYSKFAFGDVTAFFRESLQPIAQLVEAAAMAKVEADAHFLKRDFENFCSAIEGVPDDSFFRDNRFVFSPSFGIFKMLFEVVDEGIITKWRKN